MGKSWTEQECYKYGKILKEHCGFMSYEEFLDTYKEELNNIGGKNKMEYSLEDLNKMFSKFEIKNGADYWKMVIIEHLLCNEDFNNFKITENTLNEMAENVLDDDGLWQEIDYTIQNIISDYMTKGEK